MVDKDMITVKINMNVYDPYFVRADSKSTDGKATGVFKPTLTRVMAHELGHIKNWWCSKKYAVIRHNHS
ncbi:MULTISPECIES: hypothetical protein [unclassified Psychrobacter]|uniref:hypothetical protein n=1 Tax=unclassified Psychrobacter TaxID=196806 RepID=UPI0025B3D812|nr:MULTISPECIES: hypothetical protein [unclassified Psychrobacter]MDN3454652.1 hypothetical protein [Psychrobacter sp. APC 3350]MDN3503936.1 hypothetical protein [Psychrobacter sp. 5A.1]